MKDKTLKKEKTSKKGEKEEDDLQLFAGSKIKKQLLSKDNLNDNNDNIKFTIEAVSSKLNSLTEDENVKAMIVLQPQLLLLLNELGEKVTELKVKISPLTEMISKFSKVNEGSDDILEYLVAKQQILLSYCINCIYYLYLKSTGVSVKEHPVMIQLLELRYLMEKMRPLDGKLKYQIDQLMKYASMDEDSAETVNLRPNPSSMFDDISDDDNNNNVEDDDEEDDDDDDDKKISKTKTNYNHNKSNEIYRAPKNVSTPYKETESELIKSDARMLKKKNKLKNSEIMDTLREEFGHEPEAFSNSGISGLSGDHKLLQQEANERKEYEEERMIRMVMSRKMKKDIKSREREANRLDNFSHMGDIADFEELAEFTTKHRGNNNNDNNNSSSSRKNNSNLDTSSALKKAVSVFSNPDLVNKKASKKRLSISNDEDTINDIPSSINNNDISMDAFSKSKKRESIAKKYRP